MRRLPYLAVLALLLFAACNRKTVSLSYTNAKGEIPQLGNLVFRFSQSMVADSLLNNWDSAAYISFKPAIKGRFRWESPDQLVFSPAQPLDPATSYTASVSSEVLRYSKFDKVDGGDKISFRTPDLRLDDARAIWIGESGTSAQPQVDLFFNYRVNPADVKDRLKVEVENKEVPFELLTAGPDNRISIRINGVKTEDKDFSLKVKLGKGLKPAVGTNSTGEAINTSLLIPSPYVLTIFGAEAEHDGSEGVIRVNTSQQMGNESIRSYISFQPAVDFSIENTETGFVIRSDKFDQEKSYTLSIRKGLRGRLGGLLSEEYSTSVAFGQLEAGINFTNSKAVYLSRQGGRNLEVRITNVPKVKVVISKIYESNLLMAQRYGYYPQETRNSQPMYDEEYGGYDDYYGSDAMLGDVIYEKEIDTRSLPKSAGGRLLNLSSFEDRLPDFKGIYHIMIRSSEDYWVRDSRFISVSDLGIIAKEGEDKIVVFVNSIKTAQAMSGVNVAVYANNNQLIGTGAANAEGVAEIAYTKKEFSGFKPAMIIAKTAEDFNYLPFQNTRVNTSRFDVGGKRNNSSGLDAFVYAERDIYRPGEKINFSVIVRDRQWNAPGQLPLKFRFLMPNGKELKAFRKTLNDQGSTEASIDLATSVITGSYTLEVYTAADVLLAAERFSVEEFVPDRIRVNSKLSSNSARPGESVTLSVNAMNFFGPPAANRNYETEIQVRQRPFSPEKFSQYNFSLANQQYFGDKVVEEGKTDAEGNASFSYKVPDAYQDKGKLQATFYTTVFDETGRPVSRAVSADIFTQDVFFGVQQDWYYYYPLNQAVKFPLVAVNKEGDATNATAKVVVIKHEYRTVLARSGSYFRYESQRDDKVMTESQLAVGSNTVFSYIPRSPGDYELRIYRPGSNAYVSRSFYSYGSWGGDNNSFEVNNEGNIEISLEKKSYFAGESVKALFKTPFSGRMLVTVETDHIISYQYVEVSNKTASLDLKLTGEHVPNAYITATLIKPHELSDIPLTVAHGFQNVKVEEKSRKIEVAITAGKSVRSRTKQKIKVKAEPGSMVTLAAVDNGVLQVSDFKTPDPYGYFYQKKALAVTAFDLYPLLFAEVRARLSSTGGDGELDMAKRVNPMPAKRIKVVSYWSGIRKANGSGEAEFEVEIPAFSGEIRMMAVSYKGNSFGAGESVMTVADPIVISSALPRFLSPGDTVTMPVTLSNTTDKAGTVSATLKTEGAVKVFGGATQNLSIPAKSEARAVFQLVANTSIGVGQVQVQVNGLGEKFEEANEISVRPPSTLQKRTGSGVIAGGSAQKINMPLQDFMEGSSSYNLVVSRSPLLEWGDQLRYLVQYPYGCTEQTISAAFPQLYYGDIADLMQLNSQNKQNANTNVLEAIRKIKMRQLYSGAVTLWDGTDREDWWSTVYAAHFLLEARKAGFDVDNSLLETMLGYLNYRLKNRELISYYYNRDQNKKIAPKEVAYSLYVLALAGRSNVASMNYYKGNTGVLALDSRYLLAAAYAVAGDKRSFAGMLPAAFEGEVSVPQTGGSFYSDVRDEAIALNTLLEVDPGNSQVPVMIKHVSEKLKTRRWLSTQERAFAFLALGKNARAAKASSATAEIKVDGKVVAKVENGQWRGDQSALKGSSIEISTKGNGALYYYWQAEGISATGEYQEEDSYIKVRKKFYDRYGSPITGNSFRQNELVIIGITLERSFNTPIDNIVITDLLPAGFEIENPRTKEIPGMDWIRDAYTPVALDVRDDRIHFFVDAYNNRQTYYYAVRAVSPGQYKMGPVSADAMYNGEYHSYNGGGIIRITQ